ncbi:hypothetical protein [Streptomyces sp. 1331.2]|uniref:hypothetical protein n=1 Tax=Streptomyces sp. 1331.2 TaxID=1938835 RepID=UPI0015CF0DB4|nr:hypothetical protein [Streptomyces sp. 1331.2]
MVTGPVAPAVVPPKPASPPEPVTGAAGDEAAGDGKAGAPAEETRIIPKIIIVDDGADYATPNTVSYRRR